MPAGPPKAMPPVGADPFRLLQCTRTMCVGDAKVMSGILKMVPTPLVPPAEVVPYMVPETPRVSVPKGVAPGFAPLVPVKLKSVVKTPDGVMRNTVPNPSEPPDEVVP